MAKLTKFIQNGNVSILFWERTDYVHKIVFKGKTIVKKQKGVDNDPLVAFAVCCLKMIGHSNTTLVKMANNVGVSYNDFVLSFAEVRFGEIERTMYRLIPEGHLVKVTSKQVYELIEFLEGTNHDLDTALERVVGVCNIRNLKEIEQAIFEELLRCEICNTWVFYEDSDVIGGRNLCFDCSDEVGHEN